MALDNGVGGEDVGSIISSHLGDWKTQQSKYHEDIKALLHEFKTFTQSTRQPQQPPQPAQPPQQPKQPQQPSLLGMLGESLGSKQERADVQKWANIAGQAGKLGVQWAAHTRGQFKGRTAEEQAEDQPDHTAGQPQSDEMGKRAQETTSRARKRLEDQPEPEEAAGQQEPPPQPIRAQEPSPDAPVGHPPSPTPPGAPNSLLGRMKSALISTPQQEQPQGQQPQGQQVPQAGQAAPQQVPQQQGMQGPQPQPYAMQYGPGYMGMGLWGGNMWGGGGYGGGGYGGYGMSPYGGDDDDDDGGGGRGFGVGQQVAMQSMMRPTSGGLTNKVWGGVKKFVPGLGLAENVVGEWHAQQDKNNFYRSMTGEGHGEAIGDRVREEVNRVRFMGSFSEQEARATTRGVAALGYGNGPQDSENARTAGANRHDLEQFVYDAKQEYGAGIEESLGTLEVTSRNANINVTNLTKSLTDLSTSAGEAGVNAQQARAQFTAMLEASMQMGSTAPNYAEATTTSQAMLGRSFTHLDPTKQTEDTGYQYMVAASQGLSMAQYTAQTMNDPAAAMNAQTGMFTTHMKNWLLSTTPDGWAWLESQIRERKEALDQDPSRISMEIAEEFFRSHAGNMDPNAFLQMATQFSDRGGFDSHLDAMAYLITQLAGQTAGAMAKQDQAKSDVTDMQGRTKGAKGLKAPVGEEGLAEGGKEGSAKGGLRAIGLEAGVEYGKNWTIKGQGDASEVTTSYLKQAKRKGERSPVLEAMLQQMDTGAEKDQMVEVETSEGMRVVHLSVAMKHFQNQLASGKARFVGGEHGGKGIGAYTGGEVDETRASAAQKEVGRKKFSKKGFDAEDFYKRNPDQDPDRGTDKGWKGAKVKIDLTDRAASVLKVSGYEEADAAGEPKSNTHTMRASRNKAYTPGVGSN